MPVTVILECPHCERSIKTSKVVLPGTTIRCQHCAMSFRVLAAGDRLVETSRGDSLFADITPPIPPRVGKMPTPTLYGRTKTPFVGSRSFLAVLGVGGILLCGTAFFQWYSREAKDLADPTALAIKNGRKKAAAVAPEPQINFSNLSGRTAAPASKRIGDLAVSITEVKAGPVRLVTGGYSKDYLALTVRVTNLSAVPVNYLGWHDPKNNVTLRDHDRNYYNRIHFDQESRPVDAAPLRSLSPNQTITDVIVFELPPPPSLWTAYELDIPIPNTADKFEFLIAGNLQKTVQQPLKLVEPTPPAPATYDPEADPQLVRAVSVDYRDGAAKVERRLRTMSFDRARTARPKEFEGLLGGIATKYKLTHDQVRRMIR
jgi:hypothetical protein